MSSKNLNSSLIQNIPTVTPEEVFKNLNHIELIDVRRDDEYTGELGHIVGAKLVTLGPDLTDFFKSLNTQKEIVLICRSGARSAFATQEAQSLGVKNIYNMSGGMIEWNSKNLPIEK